MPERCDGANQLVPEAELLAALDRLDVHWTSMSAVRVRALLQADGFTVSEKRTKALKSQRMAAADASNTNEIPTSLQPTRSTKLPVQCAYCAVADATKICTRCMTARYCSSECQHVHWKQHKPDCKKKDQSVCPLCNHEWAACKCGEDKPACWICLESKGELLRGCACRGSAGCAEFHERVFAHADMIVGLYMCPAWLKPTSTAVLDMSPAPRVSRSSSDDCKWLSPRAGWIMHISRTEPSIVQLQASWLQHCSITVSTKRP